MCAKFLILASAFLLAVANASKESVERRDLFWWWGYKKPIVSKFELISSITQLKLFDLYDGAKIDICQLKQYGIDSPNKLNFRTITSGSGSVDFFWNNNHYRCDNDKEFSLCGSNGGHFYNGCNDLKYGYQCISAKPWSLFGGKGIFGNSLSTCFDVVGCPVPAPVMPPKAAPIKPPVRAPVPAPVPAPVMPPKTAPVMPPKTAPVPAPVRPPVRAPVPVSAPKAPVSAPTYIRAPVCTPTNNYHA